MLPQLPYTATNVQKSALAVQLGDVTYVPAESGAVTPSEIFHSSGRFIINMPEPVADRVRAGLTAELQRSGFQTTLPPQFILTCRITRIGIHQFPFGIDTVLAGELALSRAAGPPVTRMPIDLKRKHKVGTNLKTVSSDFDSMLAEAYDRFFSSAPVKTALASP
jgi:hypothetical protein